MTTYSGGTEVKPGFYWNRGAWELLTVTTDEKTLPGGGLDTFWRVPTPIMLAVAPLMGVAYVIFLPLIGFAMVFQHVGRVARRRVRALRGHPAAAPAAMRSSVTTRTEAETQAEKRRVA